MLGTKEVRGERDRAPHARLKHDELPEIQPDEED